METPVYLFTGLLDSGKTTLIYEVAREEGFLDPGTTVLIQCEEGETALEQKFLKEYSIVQVKVESSETLNDKFWRQLELDYAPAQIMVEYNGMWELEKFFSSGMPGDWSVDGIYSTVNAETAESYIMNMRKIFMKSLRISNLIIFNRCDDETDRIKFRRNLKALNPQVQVIFERKNGTLYENEKEELPFDYSGKKVVINDMDYGLWYIDAMENPKRYMNKDIIFKAKYCASSNPDEKYFIPGRHVMTCCEDDIQFLGFICAFDGESSYEHGDWVKVCVRYNYGEHPVYEYGEEEPVLTLLSIEPAEKPEQELVTFI